MQPPANATADAGIPALSKVMKDTFQTLAVVEAKIDGIVERLGRMENSEDKILERLHKLETSVETLAAASLSSSLGTSGENIEIIEQPPPTPEQG